MVLNYFIFLWVRWWYICSPAANFVNCVMTLYLLYSLCSREIHGAPCIGNSVGPRAGLDGWGKSRLPPEFDYRTVQPVASRYTDWAIPAPRSRVDRFMSASWSVGRNFSIKNFITVLWVIWFEHTAHLRQECHNSKCVIFQGRLLKGFEVL
jgi:hypothetical protein